LPADLQKVALNGIFPINDRAVIEHQLAHQVPDANGTAYNRTKFLKERRAMIHLWADYLDKLKTGAVVVPINKVA
jgi:hypothetical protein